MPLTARNFAQGSQKIGARDVLHYITTDAEAQQPLRIQSFVLHRQDQYTHIGMIAADPAHQFDTVIGPEREVDDGDIRLGAVDCGLRRLHRGSLAGKHEFALPREQLLQTFADEWMVIDDQNPCWICHGWLFPTYFASRVLAFRAQQWRPDFYLQSCEGTRMEQSPFSTVLTW
jgi:hypothetical protein